MENLNSHNKILVIFGTRPEAIKMAPLVRQLREDPRLITKVCVTAQHREMLDQVLKTFSIYPDYDLNIMQAGQSLGQITCRALEGLDQVLQQEDFQLVLVHGDTTTTLAGSLAAYYRQVAVGHVEAGLRTNNKYEPYPEEMNRRLTGALSDLHFAPTRGARENLLREGVPAAKIYVTGNTVIDALKYTVRDDYSFHNPALQQALERRGKLVLVEAHRRENWGEPLENIFTALRKAVLDYPELRLIFPVHRNPRVQEPARRLLGDLERVILADPLDTDDFHNLIARCSFIVTDSGGIQEEAPSLGKPVLVLRRVTERPEAVEAGTVKLIGTEEKGVYRGITALLEDEKLYRQMAAAVNPYGDGQACRRIVAAIRHHFGMAPRPAGFQPQNR